MLELLVTLSAFFVAVYFIVRPATIRIPFLKRRIVLDYVAGSVLGASILVVSNILTPSQAWGALLGRPGFSPYTIIILFMSMAYISISLDSTGFFEYAALKMIMRSRGDGRSLFFYIYALSSVITLFTSNDIVILTLTPIIFYFGKHAKMNMIPYLIAEFFAANIWSMFLYIGNPTNIIVSMANNLTFFEYSYWMVLPTVAGGIVNTLLLYLLFRGTFRRRFEIPKGIKPEEFLRDRTCAKVGLSVFVLTIMIMAFAPYLGIEMWAVPFLSALALFFYDATVASREYANKSLIFYKVFKRYAYRKKTKIYQFRLHMIAERMPWKVVPFLFCSFIMVESLVTTGFTDALASFITFMSPNILAASLSMGFLSSLAANLVNNQPMTVLFEKIMESQSFALSGGSRMASMFSLIIGSNLGANLTIIGALAGIMWIKILRDKKQEIGYGLFAKTGFLITPFVILAACTVLALEFMLAGVR